LFLLFACSAAVLLFSGPPAALGQTAAGNSTQTATGSTATLKPSFDLESAAVATLVLVLLGLAAALALLARWASPGNSGLVATS
jgi:hypothetical protein